ncbi:nuclear transport factor 2 family protein [Halobaculum sp. EA56]|uniref:nuclear transport factor 2 family protein n=1 Tax=Halobaculum sp. EA56 TaxID=3421648 RepID=UPI003EB94BC8
MTSEATARAYYRAIDDGDYDALADLLAPEFVHDRPDRTLSGRERFVRFMREGRPRTDTEHAVDAVYVASGEGADPDGDAARDGADPDGDALPGVAVRGRLIGDDGEELFGFVDVFAFAGAIESDTEADAGSGADGDAAGLVVRLTTYTN